MAFLAIFTDRTHLAQYAFKDMSVNKKTSAL